MSKSIHRRTIRIPSSEGDEKALTTRMPDDLYEWLKANADAGERSVQRQIILLLRQARNEEERVKQVALR